MDSIAPKLQSLGDLELAVLLSLIAENPCIITAKSNLLDDLAQELRLIATRVFDLSCAVVDCANITLDDFREAVLVDVRDDASGYDPQQIGYMTLPTLTHKLSPYDAPRSYSGLSNSLDERRVANLVIAKDLNLADSQVQTQALELINRRRLYSHTAMHATQGEFVLVSLQSTGSARLGSHLNDLFCVSHEHLEEDGFPNLEEEAESRPARVGYASSTSSILRSPPSILADSQTPTISKSEITHLRKEAASAKMGSDVASYLHNIVIFMRLNRYIAGGVSARATRHFRTVTQILAPLHNLTYCPPALVALAARKVYPHRLVLATAKNERSLQWGSDPQAVADMLQDMTVEKAIDSVLADVEAPL